MSGRRRIKQTDSLKDRLEAFAVNAREDALRLSGAAKEEMLKKVQQAEIAAHFVEWSVSAGSPQPKFDAKAASASFVLSVDATISSPE